MWQDILKKDKQAFNTLATHPLQSYEWGEFREKTGIHVIRRGLFKNKKLLEAFQLTLHSIPHTSWTIGYLPKTTIPSKEMIEELKIIGEKYKCIFIQLEPNIVKNNAKGIMQHAAENKEFQSILHDSSFIIHKSAHPLFTKYTFLLDLTKTDDELLKQMNQKTRYNVKVAQKHNVLVKEETSEDAFKTYLKLTQETTNRQGFYAHTPKYHKTMWETLRQAQGKLSKNSNELTAHLLIAYYQNQPLVTWILFTYHDTLYYPYGASSSKYREVMASNLMMWEVVKFGKKLGLKKFDMWGALGEKASPKDPWYGFHKFKMGYGPQLVEFVGSYDLVINVVLYQLYKLADKLRWIILKLKK